MKILLSTALFYPSRLGGPANTLYWLAKALVREGIQVFVITTDSCIEAGKVIPDTWYDIDGIKVRYCKAGKWCIFKELWNTWKIINKCNTVLLCDIFQRQVLPVAFMARIFRKHIIWSPRGELFEPALEGNNIKLWYINIVKKCFSKHATFHATSFEEREMILKHFGKDSKIVIIPNYIEIPQQLKREQQSVPYFLFVGRVNRIKALDRLILGFAKSEHFKQSKYKLIIAGPNQNNFRQELETLIIENDLCGRVEFIDGVFGQEKYQLFANAHYSCLLSHSENFGNVVIEALSQGTPVIASTGTPWQSLNDNNAGFWIDNTPESIACCIDKIMEFTEQQYADMRHNAFELATSFDVYKNIDRWIKVI